MTAIVFTPQGQGRCLYTEAIDLNTLGKLHVERATRIEFDNRLGAWRVRDRSGFPLFTAPTRLQCLDWEEKYFESKEELSHGEKIEGPGEPPLCSPFSVGVCGA